MQIKRLKRNVQTLACFVSIISFWNDHHIQIALLAFRGPDLNLNSWLFHLVSLYSKSRQESIRVASTWAYLIDGADIVFHTDYINILHAL